MINICTRYGFDILIISGGYGGHTMGDGREMTNNEVDIRQLCSSSIHKYNISMLSYLCIYANATMCLKENVF